MSTSPARRSTARRWQSWRRQADARRVPAQDHPRRDRDRHPDSARTRSCSEAISSPSSDADPRHASSRRSRAWAIPTAAPTVADVAFIGAAIAIGALLGAVVYKVGSVPLTLVHLRRRVDFRPVLRLAALGAPDLRTVSVADGVVHEFGRSECVHRRCRHLVGTGLRRWAATARLQSVPLGRCRNDGAADLGDVRRKIPVSFR